MNISINTCNGISKVIFNGMVLAQLSERDIADLATQIFLAQIEMDIVKKRICTMCGDYQIGIEMGVCNNCTISCEMTGTGEEDER
jgi:hypothetical protein